MKHTIAQNKQLFNVNEIAYATTLDDLADGQFGIYPVDSDTSVAAGTTYDTLPDEIRILSKFGGKVYYGFDSFRKEKIRAVRKADYQAPQVNIWKASLEHCACVKSATIRIGLEEDSLMRQNGLSWTNMDSTVQDTSQEIKCFGDCSGDTTYDNNILTRDIAQRLNTSDSPFYLARVEDQAGNVLVGDAIDTFIDAQKAADEDADDLTVGENLVLVIEGKPQAARDYKDLDINHIFPRGVKLFPAIVLGDGATVEFEETQEIVYEIGAGRDLRAEEFDNMNYYTDLNHYPQLHDGIATDALVYQFSNSEQYSTLDFEFYTDKVNKNDGDQRSFGVMLASTDDAVITELETIFKD